MNESSPSTAYHLFSARRRALPHIVRALAACATLGCDATMDEPTCAGDACAPQLECDGPEWSCQPVPLWTPRSFGGHVALAAAPDGSVAATFYDSTEQALVVGRAMPGQQLQTILVDGQGEESDVGRSNDAAFAPDGSLHVVYGDATANRLKWARVEGLTVTAIEVVDTGSAKLAPSLALGADGTAHVTYYDAEAQVLRYARRDASGAWSAETVPHRECGDKCTTTRDYGRFSSLGLLADAPVVAYYDRTGGDLILARREGASWTSSIIDGMDALMGVDTGDVGRWPSLRVGSGGNLSIAYQDATNGALRYAASPGGALLLEIVDDGSRPDPVHGARWDGVVGAYVRLTSSADGSPVVYYFDSTAVAIMRSARGPTGWSIPERISGESPAGLWLGAVRMPDGSNVICAESWQPQPGSVALLRMLKWWVK